MRAHLFVVSVVASLASCSETKPSSPSPPPIELGSLVALSGGLSGTGQDNNNAADLAVKQINAAGGVLGRTLSLVVEDDETTVEGARAKYTKLVDRGVTAIIGPSASSQVLNIADLIAANQTLTIGRTSTSPLLARLLDNDFFFRLVPSDLFQAKPLARLVSEAGLERLCVVERDDAYGTPLTEAILATLTPAPRAIRAKYNPSELDLSGVLRACDPLLCDDAGADAGASAADAGTECSPAEKVGLLVVGYVTEAKQILLGAPAWSATKQRFFLPDGARDTELIRLGVPAEKLQGAVGTMPSGPDPASLEGDLHASYRNAYQQRYGKPASWYSTSAFDAVYAIAAAIEIAGSTDRVAVRDALRKTSTPGGVAVTVGDWPGIRAAIARKGPINMRGASGNVDFDGAGDIAPPYDYRIWRMEGGESVTVGFERVSE